MGKDLRTFLEFWEKTHPQEIVHVDRPISTKWEVTALQTKLERMGRFPILVMEHPVKTDGNDSVFKLVTNVTASRRRSAEILGISPERAAVEYGKKSLKRGKPYIVTKDEAPVKQVVKKDSEVDLCEFPIVWNHEMDPGPFITGGVVTTCDPDTGIDNCAFQRLWVRGKQKTGYYPIPTHNWRNMMKFWQTGEDAPVAIWIGHHPAVLLGGSIKLGYPESHYPAMCGLLEESIGLVPTESFGEKLLVPSDAEIVIEGVIPKGVYEPEGPFGEYSGLYGGQQPNPIIKVKCVTRRKDAIYYHVGAGLADHQLMGCFPLEARIYETLRAEIPEVTNVHLPLSGCCRFHAYVQLKKTRPGIGIDAILGTLPCHWSLRHVFVFDEDIDIFEEREVLWAIATRSYLGGSIQVPDPRFGYKGGVDCTRPAPLAPGLPSIAPLRNSIPIETWDNTTIEKYLPKNNLDRIPRD